MGLKTVTQLANVAIFVFALALSLSTAAASSNDDNLNNNSYKNKTREYESSFRPRDISPLIFGEALHLYYDDQYYFSLSRLLTAQQTGLISPNDPEAQTFIGQLLLKYGLMEQADQRFGTIDPLDIPANVTADIWFDKATLLQKRGNSEIAEKMFAREWADLSLSQENYRRTMLANLLMGRRSFEEALIVLKGVSPDSILYPYALYNIGVALNRLDRLTESAEALDQVINVKSYNGKQAALKDKAAITLGHTYLQQGEAEKATEIFHTVRLNGPFSNSALLGLGLAEKQQGRSRRALVAWAELAKRSAIELPVQEAIALIPATFEETGNLQHALDAYRLAVIIFRKEIEMIDETILFISDGDWALELMEGQYDFYSDKTSNPDISIHNLGQEVPMAATPRLGTRKGVDSDFLYRLFATRRFNDSYVNFIELKRLRDISNHWSTQIPIFRETVINHENVYRQQESRHLNIITRSKALARNLKQRLTLLDLEVNLASAQGSSINNVNYHQIEQQKRLEWVKGRLQSAPSDIAYDNLRERVRRLAGVLAWNKLLEQPEIRINNAEEIQLISEQLEQTNIKISSLEYLELELVQRFDGDYLRRLAQQEVKLYEVVRDIDVQLAFYKSNMESLALDELTENRSKLVQRLIAAQLRVIDIEDGASTSNQDRL